MLRPRQRALASRFGTHALCTVLSTLLVWAPFAAYTPRAEAQDIPEISESAAAQAAEAESLPAVIDDQIAEDVESAASEAIDTAEAAEAAAEGADTATPVSLPGGETRTSVNPQAISLPNAEGSIEGMGESFSPILSSGTATFGVPIAVAPGRAGVQPSVSLSYSSSGGNGALGFGWGFGVPFISRQTDRGLPTYDDRTRWHPGEDHFIYNGGQELVPVDNAAIAIIDGQASGGASVAAPVPTDVAGWQQYRARVEGGFMRFFRAPPSATGDVRRWVVQSPDGSRFDFGALSTGQGASDADSASSLEVDDETGTRVFRWMITRSSDAHGSTIYYRYRRDQGQLYVSDISYVSPASCGVASVAGRRDCTAPLESYGARVRFVYEARGDAFTTYTSGYPVTTALRLRRVEVTAFEDSIGARALVRRYHLRYEDGPFHSLLSSIQVEGRPSVPVGLTVAGTSLSYEVGVRTIAETRLGEPIVGALLPPMRFRYSTLPTGPTMIAGFGALSTRVVDVPGSPPNSIDEARTELMDVNSDGLPDLVVTDPARYRTASGQPAAGVFFNGFSGTEARPATAGTFSGAVPVPMRSDLSGVMAFSNLNIVPMDMDGDGRGDLLHMPRERTYGWFTPVRTADPASGAPFTSPSQQGWRFAYAEIDLPRDDLDPRIDLGRDGQHIQVVDVNNDHLVDVVRTTGTVMQTWLNLGWLPGGDGRFGSYTITGTGALSTSNVRLSTAPYESCVLQSGLPFDFESPEARFADMNGDGLQDIVEIQRGRIRYWPGRGLGSWGFGPRMCPRGAGANRYIEFETSPPDLPIDLAGVQLTDIDGDGASDIVAVRFDAIDVWFNRAGQSFTERLVLRGTPPAPGFANRVRFTDIDGSGTIDAVYGDGSGWRFVDLLASSSGTALRPRLLVGVENGLGAETSIAYESAAVDYLRDLAEARACGTSCESFTWARIEGEPSRRLARLSDEPDANLYRAGGTPVLSTVVRSVRTTDRMSVFGREEQVSESTFAYHDGYYEGIEQEFRGFGAADAIVVGDVRNGRDESVLTRTWFHQGRRPSDIADDRLAWSEDEALKGREYLTEVFDRQGTFLTTSHASLTTRLLSTGQDGRPIQYAFVSEMNEIRYDTSPFLAGGAGRPFPSVHRERVSATTGVPSPDGDDAPRMIAMRGASYAQVRTTYDEVDNLGHVLEQTVYGHVDAPGWVGNTDEAVTSVTEPQILNDGGQWIWRTRHQFGRGTDASYRFGDTTTVFDTATGDPIRSTTLVSHAGVPPYAFGGDPSGEGGAFALSNVAQPLESTTWFDPWGSSVAACAGAALTSGLPSGVPSGCYRFGTVAYDSLYQQFPVTETAYVSQTATLATSVPTDTANPGWDRGLGAVRRVVDPNSQETSLTHDGLGRLTTMTPPPVARATLGPMGETSCARIPTTLLAYELTPDGRTRPMSRVVTTQILRTADCEMLDDDDVPLGTELPTSTAIGYVDGLGRVRATLAQAERDTPEHQWIRSGLAILDRKGQVIQAFHPSYLEGSSATAADLDYATVLSPTSGTPSALASMHNFYDPFGRTQFTYAEDGSLTTTAFHAASTTVCDPLDNTVGTVFSGTCTTSRSDGFGRVVDQILVESTAPGTSDDRYDRLWSYYRADGVVLTLVRTQTTDQAPRPAIGALTAPNVRRDFVYDSVGRRLGSFDPDTDNPFDASTATRTWRYRFNRVGDLVGVRDPRGCGQNFIYDLGGRLLGEQYVSCGESQTAAGDGPVADVPGGISETVLSGTTFVDVRYEYDTYPTWLADASITPPSVGGTSGRATGVTDRGQRSAVAYDHRGNAIWTARQMALMPAALPLSFSEVNGLPLIFDNAAGAASVSFDDAHTYVRTSDYDHAGRGRRLTLPLDPDFGSAAPLVRGELRLDARGLPIGAHALVGEERIEVLGAVDYDQEGQVQTREWGAAGSRVLEESFEYDIRNRPLRHEARRPTTSGTPGMDINAVGLVAREEFGWDAASNLIELRDTRPVSEWPMGHRPRNTYIGHDSLYRVAQVSYEYRDTAGYGVDTANDWRDDASAANANAPMHPRPAPMVGESPTTRIQQLDYEWDWLGNQIEWLDDAWEDAQRPSGQTFYERGIGNITNGRDVGGRPSALYLSTNIPSSGVEPGWEGAGWVEVAYGVSGNVESFTVHGQCAAAPTCADPGGSLETRLTALRGCACADEQHYSLRWDELNRLVEGRRFDRVGTTWSPAARMRYRYDGANQRTVKESFAAGNFASPERYALYVYPGDFERRGLTSDGFTYQAIPTGPDATETQYLIAGARIVWDAAPGITSPGIDRNRRATINASDLLGTTAASLDLVSGDLLEVSTYYPNGGRENLWNNVQPGVGAVPLEPMGFTGKEADEEIGVTYFGERWLIPRLGRWATPDPLHVHAGGGGEALNSYHYVSGNLLQAVDPLGLDEFDFQQAIDSAAPGVREEFLAGDRQTDAHNMEAESVVIDRRDIPLVARPEIQEDLAFQGAVSQHGATIATLWVGPIIEDALQSYDTGRGIELSDLERLNPAEALRRDLEEIQALIDTVDVALQDAPSAERGSARGHLLGLGLEAGAQLTLGAAMSGPGTDFSSTRPRPGGCPTCGCFLPGTMVLMADGRTLPIETLRVGDLVVAWDPETDGEPEAHPVVDVIPSVATRIVVLELLSRDGVAGVLRVTGEHPFWVVGAGWVAADSLRAGDRLVDGHGRHVAVSTTAEASAVSVTYNLTVDGVSTFVVDANGVQALVHNQLRFPQADLYPAHAPGQSAEVLIRIQGSRGRDYTQAFRAAGIRPGDIPLGPDGRVEFVWHHVADMDADGQFTMQLVRRSAHEAVGHGGAVREFESMFAHTHPGMEYGSEEALELAAQMGWRADLCP